MCAALCAARRRCAHRGDGVLIAATVFAVQAAPVDAEEVLGEMRAAGLAPPPAAFNALLSCYARAARGGAAVRAADAVEVVRRMEAAGRRRGRRRTGRG